METIRFINSLILKAPSERKRSTFLARLDTLGLYDTLYKISQEPKKEKAEFVNLLN